MENVLNNTRENTMSPNTTNSKESVSLANTIYVPVNDRKIAVKKLGLITYSIMVKELNTLINSIFKLIDMFRGDTEFSEMSENEITSNLLSELISTNIEGLMKFLDIAVPDLGYEYICDFVGLEDLILLIEAIIEVNNLNSVVTKTKNLLMGLRRN